MYRLRTIDFVGKRKYFLILSAALILISLISIGVRGFNFGVDFAGGTEITLVTNETMDVSEVRSELSAINPEYETAKILRISPMTGQETATERFSVTIPRFMEGDEKDLLIAQLSGFRVDAFDTVSGLSATELRDRSMWAVLVTIIIILVYIAIRFQIAFGIGAILALAHDGIITMGIFSLFQIPFDISVIAALLTLLGYSLNDTIVVYDRIRENIKKFRHNKITQTVNTSINEVLNRTINTSLTTFIVVFMLLLFGGTGLQPFAFGLTIGVLVGTYSSIYVASPVLIGFLKSRR